MGNSPPETNRTLTAPRGVAISGMVFSALFIASLVLLRLAVPADPAEPGAWLADPILRHWIRISLKLVPFAGIAFLWFMAVVRNHIGRLEDRFFGTVFLGSGLLFVAMLFAAGAAAESLLDTFGSQPRGGIPGEPYSVMRRMAYSLMNTFGTRMAAVFMFVTSTIGLRTSTLPRWVSFVGFAFGLILLLVITEFAGAMLLFPCWVLLVSIWILIVDLRSPPSGLPIGHTGPITESAGDRSETTLDTARP